MPADALASDLFEQAERALRSMSVELAISLYGEAEAAGFDPDRCAGARWICRMLLGDYSSAWAESDAIAARGAPDPNRWWDGKPLTGDRVLVRCLHGLGDTLQYARFLPLLRQQATFLALEAQPTMKTLLAQSGLADLVTTWGEPEPPHDREIEIVELPLIFRATLDTLPRQIPYIFASSDPVALRRSAHRPKIGIVWAASSFNPARNLSLSEMEPILKLLDADFFSFQGGPQRAELQNLNWSVTDLCNESAPMLTTARNVFNMDLVITADTMMAHLAGAIGLPVWTMLPFQCDWRWLIDRQDCPWYPTMRLFRQSDPGQWSPVVASIASELQSLINEKCSSSKPHASHIR